jgi:CIC family chloride channel protein
MVGRQFHWATADRLGLLTRQRLLRSAWLGVVIGLVAGGGAIAFYEGIDFATEHLLGNLAGYHPPAPLGEGSQDWSGPSRRWVLPLLLGAGGLLSGLIVWLFAPEAEGHGTDAAIDAFHHKGGRVRLRVVPVKLVASAITIGSGGAAGREGPTAQIGAGFGSFIADRLHLEPAERRRALAAGMGAGIGAIFRAPLGGAMMAAEVLYKHDFEADIILLGLISSIVAYSVFGAYTDYTPVFGGAGSFSFTHPSELPYYAALGIACGLFGLAYARSFYGVTRIFKKAPLPVWAKPAIGGVLVGSIGMAAPEAIHVGYGWVQQAFTREGVMEFSPWLLLLLPALRIVTTSLTVGSGGSGGIFGPGMVIGGLIGAAYWRIGHELPGFPQEPGPVVIIGMTAMFGSIAHAPLAMLLMVAEMTGNLSLLGPAMIAVAIATLLVGDESIYRSQVATRADSPAHRHRFAFPLLTALPAGRAAIPVPVVDHGATPEEIRAAMEASRVQHAIVRRDDGSLGEVLAADLRDGSVAGTAGSLSRPLPASVQADWPLDRALDLLNEHDRRWLPVVDGPGGEVLGSIDARTLLRSYRRAAALQMRQLAPLAEEMETVEVVIQHDAPVARRRLSDAQFPSGARIVALRRDGHTVVPDGATILLPGDVATVTLGAGTRTAVFELLAGAEQD